MLPRCVQWRVGLIPESSRHSRRPRALRRHAAFRCADKLACGGRSLDVVTRGEATERLVGVGRWTLAGSVVLVAGEWTVVGGRLVGRVVLLRPWRPAATFAFESGGGSRSRTLDRAPDHSYAIAFRAFVPTVWDWHKFVEGIGETERAGGVCAVMSHFISRT